jgi:TolB-like protein
MSPEQARGKAVDRRADIWSFGAVLFEMLSGRRPFAGETVSDIVASVLRQDPDWTRLPGETPEAVRRLFARCLDRDVKKRLQAIGEARLVLDEAGGADADRVLSSSGRPVARPAIRLLSSIGPVVAAAIVVAVIIGTRGRSSSNTNVPASRGTRSIAVLPFINSRGSADDEYFADGMTDELIASPGKVPGLRVAARSSAFSFKGQKAEAREVGRKLGVDTVLEGTIRRSGQRVRVTASLVGASDGLQLWSSSFENNGGDPFAVQDEVTRGVVTGLSLEFGGSALASSQAGRTKDPQAHDLYLRGLSLANMGSEAELRRALELYQQALARDPGFALPYVGMASVHSFLADGYVPPNEAYPRAKAAAQAALARDSRLADAHAPVAYATFAASGENRPSSTASSIAPWSSTGTRRTP